MNGREKIEAAFSAGGSPEFGAVICYEGIYIRDHWRQLTGLPWWYSFAPDVERAMRWRGEVYPAIGQDWTHLPACRSRAKRQELEVVEREGRVFLHDRSSNAEVELFEPSVGGWEIFQRGYDGHAERGAHSVEQLDALIPAPEPFDASAYLAAGHGDLAAQVLAGYGAGLYPIEHVSAPLWSCYWLWGFEGMMEKIALEPTLVRAACDRFLRQEIAAVRRAAAIGVKGIWIEDCMTDMVHPRDFAALHLPGLRALVEEIRACGMHSIHYFCGSPAGKLELILSAGPDALSLEESKKGFRIDIEEVAAVVDGRCALLGNLDAIHLLPNASEADLRAGLARQAAAGRRNRGRFVFSTGSPVTPGTSPERVRLYCELAREAGRSA